MALRRVAVLKPNPRSFVLARKGLIDKLGRAANVMAATAETEFEGVAKLTAERAPAASGQTQDAVHTRGRVLDSKDWVAGVGVKMLANGQEVQAEAGRLPNLHLNEEDHDHGKLCSTGYSGGWGDPYERENVRELRGGETRGNANARQWFFGSALVERLGPIVDEEQASRFRRGAVNVYRTGVGIVNSTKLGKLMRRAAALVFKTVLLAVVGWSMWSGASYAAGFQKESKERIIAVDSSLAAGGWVRTRAIKVDYNPNMRGLFDLHLSLVTDTSAALVCYAAVGSDTTALYPQYDSAGDTIWVISPDAVYKRIGWAKFDIPVQSGDYFSLMFQDRGAQTCDLDSLSYVVMK